ncbi:MAG TPA: hypothetical protein PK176_04540 [Acidobacteriota bacterium]|nr:hypothetical protein [Acidobacteriota bacterium]HQM62556.1 hypothetical protein [Acidobacteriota bacterium]
MKDFEVMEPAERLWDFFVTSFHAADIADPLPSFDAQADLAAVREVMNRRGYVVAGIREDGLVTRHLHRQDTATDEIAGPDPIRPEQTVHGEMPLHLVIGRLADEPFLFVRTLGEVNGVIHPAGVEKPPGRMWLFGMVTLLDMRATVAISLVYANQPWREHLAPGRLAKAEALHAERLRRGHPCRLEECLQLSDKVQLLARNGHFCSVTQVESRRQFKIRVKELESLRNNLAHAQDLVPHDWPIIMTLATDLDRMLLRPRLQMLRDEVIAASDPRGPAVTSP